LCIHNTFVSKMESDSKMSFKYFPSNVVLQQYQMCPLCLPDIKFAHPQYSITSDAKLPHGIKLDAGSGGISGFTSAQTESGTHTLEITCSNPADPREVQVTTFTIMVIGRGDESTETWLEPGRVMAIWCMVGEPLRAYQFRADLPLHEIEKFEYVQCVPYDKPLIDGITFDTESGQFGGTASEPGKCSFRVKIHLVDKTINSAPFVIDVKEKQREIDEADAIKLMTAKEIKEKSKGDKVELGPENVYNFCATANGLTEENLQRAMLLLKKSVTMKLIKKLFKKYSKGGYVTLEGLNEMIANEKLLDITFDIVRECFVDLFGEVVERQVFEDLVTTRGDVLNEECLSSIYEIADPSDSGVLNIDALEELL